MLLGSFSENVLSLDSSKKVSVEEFLFLTVLNETHSIKLVEYYDINLKASPNFHTSNPFFLILIFNRFLAKASQHPNF